MKRTLTSECPFDSHRTLPEGSSNERISSILRKANGGTVTISNAARQKAEKLFSEDLFSDKNMPINSSVRTSSILQKANGGKVFITEEGRERAAKVLACAETLENISILEAHPGTSSSSAHHLKTVSTTLQKANGAEVFISESVRQKAANIFSDSSIDHRETKPNAENNSVAMDPKETNEVRQVARLVYGQEEMCVTGGKVSTLLQKANGGRVIISEAAKQKAESLFASDLMDHSTATSLRASESIDMQGIGQLASSRVSSILQKASGGKVVISESAQQKARQLLENSLIENSDDADLQKENIRPISSVPVQIPHKQEVPVAASATFALPVVTPIRVPQQTPVAAAPPASHRSNTSYEVPAYYKVTPDVVSSKNWTEIETPRTDRASLLNPYLDSDIDNTLNSGIKSAEINKYRGNLRR